MKPYINSTTFNMIDVDDDLYNFDILIRLNGEVVKRNKKLSKEALGTGHMISLAEAKYSFEEGAEVFIIGSGQEGILDIAEDAEVFIRSNNCEIIRTLTPRAIDIYNKEKRKVIGLFHITC